MKIIELIFFAGIIAFLSSCDQENISQVKSPDQTLLFSLHPGPDLQYAVSFRGKEVILPSSLGFTFTDGSRLEPEAEMTSQKSIHHDQTWSPLYGERSQYRDHYHETLFDFRSSQARPFSLRVRAFNEGVAFRYEFDFAKSEDIASEETSFVFNTNPTVWASTRAQSEIIESKLSDMEGACERPFLVRLDDSLFAALGEAALVDFARMKLSRSQEAHKVDVVLGIDQPHSEASHQISVAKVPAGHYATPWRFIMVAEAPAQLLENNYLLLNLNDSNQIVNPDWIKPGKVIREVSLTTQGGLACVDFAVKHNLQFVEFDAGWYGNEYAETSDATTVTVDPKRSPGPLDLPKVVDYAKQQDIGIILYVNRRAMEQQLDDLLPLYQSWGIAGLKYGFVNVGSQRWTSWLHEAVRKAADHQLMIDIHDEYRPTGYSRTYPNLMTQEGIRGDEESPSNEMVLNTLFTRMLAGAGDHTNCFFADRVDGKMGGHISQMAKAICIYSPWQFLYWYDRPSGSPSKKGGAGGGLDVIPELPELIFYDQLPTVWDDTKILDGYPGEFAVVARQKEHQWFVAVLTGRRSFHLARALDFLDPQGSYIATIFQEDDSLNSPTGIRMSELNLNHETLLDLSVKANSGLAIILTKKQQ